MAEAAARRRRVRPRALHEHLARATRGRRSCPRRSPRIRELRALLPDGVRVQVDGGVGPENVREIRDAGADLLVAGSAVFASADIRGGLSRGSPSAVA